MCQGMEGTGAVRGSNRQGHVLSLLLSHGVRHAQNPEENLGKECWLPWNLDPAIGSIAVVIRECQASALALSLPVNLR